MLALLGVSVVTGLTLGMSVTTVIRSINNGIGSTLGGTIMVLAIGAMIGKLAEESGAAQKLVIALSGWFGMKNIQWAVLSTGLLAGIPLFYNAGFVVLIPLVYAIAKATRLSLLYVGLPMAASLSVTHGFLPPHPGPIALAGIFKADIGKTLLYGLLLAFPISSIAGVFYAKLVAGKKVTTDQANIAYETISKELPSSLRSFLIILSPVVFIAIGTLGTYLSSGSIKEIFLFLQEPMLAVLFSLLLTIFLVGFTIDKSMLYCVEGVKSIAIIILIIAAGGAFKQILVDSKVGEEIKIYTSNLNLSPLVLGWMIAAIFRVALGSATVAALMASGIVVPFLTAGVSSELMVLSVGAGSLMCSHVNDTGFWMFKEYFGLTMKQTFQTWTVMESLISLLGLFGVLLLDVFI